MKWLLRLLVLVAAGCAGYYVLFLHSPALEGPEFPLDLAQVRQLSGSVPGPRPSEVRFEHVGSFEFRRIMVVAGDSWAPAPMPVYAYQLVFPDRTIVIDSGMARSQAKPDFMIAGYDDQAFARVTAALSRAAAIVVTHEHSDHIGGLAAHPQFASLLPHLQLTVPQLEHPEKMRPAELPAAAYRDYRALAYERLHALAPGVVLIRAGGHTPGSQMVYVQLADGRELLLLGDVAWHRRSIELERERPWLMTLIIGEDRQAVLGQFRTLKRLAHSEPGLRQMPGHDGIVMRALVEEGLMQPGFLPERRRALRSPSLDSERRRS